MTLAPIKSLMFIEWIIFIFLCICSFFFIPKGAAITFIVLILLCAISTTVIFFDIKKNIKKDEKLENEPV